MEYKLFNSDGKTFFDFRSRPESRCEGFTVSYLDDGTSVMSGDYGCLCWKRGSSKDYGFPDKHTNSGYFSEKVTIAEDRLRIKTWDPELAEKEIKKHFKDVIAESDDKEENARIRQFVRDLSLSSDWYTDTEFCVIGENEMLEQLNEFNPQGDWTDGHIFGERYTDRFVFQFECLKSVSEQILQRVKEEGTK